MTRPRVQEDPMVTDAVVDWTVKLYAWPRCPVVREMAKPVQKSPTSIDAKPFATICGFVAVTPNTELTILSAGSAEQDGEHSLWPRVRLHCSLWRYCPGTKLEQCQIRGRRGAKALSVPGTRKVSPKLSNNREGRTSSESMKAMPSKVAPGMQWVRFIISDYAPRLRCVG